MEEENKPAEASCGSPERARRDTRRFGAMNEVRTFPIGIRSRIG